MLEGKAADEAALLFGAPASDILDSGFASEHDVAMRGEIEDSPRSDDDGRAGPLAKKMWNTARRNVRSEEVWARFSSRVLMTCTFMTVRDVSLIFFAYARVKYRDTKVLGTVSPFLLRHATEFTATELVLLLNAHKKLEYDRLDNMHLLLDLLCRRSDDWTEFDVSLAANAVSYYYIHKPRFWALLARKLPKLVWKMSPLNLSNVVSSLARVDRRDRRQLALLARLCRKCALGNLFGQETLSTTVNSFAKLDFNHSRLSKAFEDAILVKLNQALELGPTYRASSLSEDVFDVQSLSRLLFVLVCLVGASDAVVTKLLTLITWSRGEVSQHQLRVLRTMSLVLQKQRPDLCGLLDRNVRDTLIHFSKASVNLTHIESRWGRELRHTLTTMKMTVELKPLVDPQVCDIWLPSSSAVVIPVGPFNFYADTTHRTAYSKLHQRLLEMSGYSVLVVPYYEWSELKTEEDKMVYLWSMGRRAAARDSSEGSQPEIVDDRITSDLSDVDSGRQ